MRPGPAIEVVAADARPDIVDDTHLGVHVHRRALVVFDIEHMHSLRARLAARLDRLADGQSWLGGSASRPSTSGCRGTTATRCRSGLSRSAWANSCATRFDHRYWSSR